MAWLKEILRYHCRGCNKKEMLTVKKTTNELKSIATEISCMFGCFLNVTEVVKVNGKLKKIWSKNFWNGKRNRMS